jgi:hypothetical protein
MIGANVLRVNSAEEERLFLEAVHKVIARILIDREGRTFVDISEAIGCDKKTISNAFNRRHGLSQLFLTRLGQAFGPHVLDPIAALSGGRMVPIEEDANADALPTTTAAIHKLAVARSPSSPGGDRITHTELLDMEPEIDAAIRALNALKGRCEKVRAA